MAPVTLNSSSKIVIVGTSGSGKTTLARALSRKYHMDNIELDALFWGPNWTPSAEADFRARVEKAMMGAGWVACGNYSKVRNLMWTKADVILWLDYPRWLVTWRIFRRSVLRAWRHEKIFSGNTEEFRRLFLSRDSVILWSLQTYSRNRKLYTAMMQDPSYGPKMIRITDPQIAEKLGS